MSDIDLITTQVNYLNITSNRSLTYIKEHKQTTFWVNPKLQTFHYNIIYLTYFLVRLFINVSA